LPDAHVALGWALTWRCQYSAAIAEFERATALNPNLTNFRFAHTLLVAGELARAVQVLQMHMRLDPFYQPHAPGYLGFAYYLLKQYAEAVPHLQECVSRAPTLAQSRHWLAATYAQLGQFDRARSEAAEGLSIQPWYTISQAFYARLCKRPEDAEHFKDGLRKAGYPE
jgi:tetratricopeptide (TPR) repeat protein